MSFLSTQYFCYTGNLFIFILRSLLITLLNYSIFSDDALLVFLMAAFAYIFLGSMGCYSCSLFCSLLIYLLALTIADLSEKIQLSKLIQKFKPQRNNTQYTKYSVVMTNVVQQQNNKIDYCLQLIKITMNDCDSFLTTLSEKQRNSLITSQPKFISANVSLQFIFVQKWQKYMIESLKLMSAKYQQKKNLVVDLITIVSNVSEESIVQATLKIRPFKPEFQPATSMLTITTQSTMVETVAKNIKYTACKIKTHQQNKKRLRITQKTLTQQFDKDYHPFKFIIKNFTRLLELKFKSRIDNKKLNKINTISSELKSDMAIFSQFLHKAAQPYKRLFKTTQANGELEQTNKFEQFLDTFIQQNQKLNKCIHKVFSYACTSFYKQKINSILPDQTNLEDFKYLPEDFKIDGCYIRSINSLMNFGQLRNPQKIMKKLVQIRENILVDISQYYLDRKQQKELEVSAEVQIEIIRFCLSKLKNWAIDILASLKLLQFVYGDEQMGYKYEESSYMYTQLSMAFEVMQLD